MRKIKLYCYIVYVAITFIQAFGVKMPRPIVVPVMLICVIVFVIDLVRTVREAMRKK